MNPSPIISLARRAAFSCGAQLARADFDAPQNAQIWGKAARAHGHDYVLTVFYAGHVGSDGMIVNLDELKPLLQRVIAPLDGAFLNDLFAFETHVPTLENLCLYLQQQLPSQLGAGILRRVHLRESATRWIEWTPKTMKLTTKYEFAAAHRLHSPQLSQAQNEELYGKCNNPRGHGHNYGLEVTIAGQPDENGQIVARDELDELVNEEVFARFDHRHLNEDCPEFKGMVPTSENLARVIFDLLDARLQGANYRLAKIGLHETQKNYFEVEAADVA